VVEAARLAKAGASKEEILEKIKYIRENTELFIGFSTLENLVKGGRVSRIYLIFSKISSLDAPAFARRAASTT
ncbi:DegV family protein, partial [Lactococcus lactis]